MTLDKLKGFIDRASSETHFQDSVTKLETYILNSGMRLEVASKDDSHCFLLPKTADANELWLRSRVEDIKTNVQEFRYFSFSIVSLKFSVDEDRVFVPFAGFGIIFAPDISLVRKAAPLCYSKLLKSVGLGGDL